MIQSLLKSSSGVAVRVAILLCTFVCPIAMCNSTLGQGKDSSTGKTELPDIDVTPAATVNGFTITKNQIFRELREANAGQKDLPPPVVASALRHLVRKQVVLAELQKGQESMGPSELIMEIGKIETRFAETGTSLDEHIATAGATRDEFDNELLWRTVWQRTLDARLTEKSVEAYFELHHNQFDGTQLNVDQVLWIFSPEDTPAQREKMREQARDVHRRLNDSELEWNQAVREFSMSPLAKQPEGKSERWIGFHGPMPESFANAAFALKPGEFSSPVESVIGLHIIKCIEVLPGDRKLGEVVTDVRGAMAEELFEMIAETAMPSQQVEYSGLVPYFGPDGKLVEPTKE